MTLPQLLVYLAFALGSTLGYLGWMHLLARLRRRRWSPPERLLNGRQRLELEQTVIAALQRQCRQHAPARQRWVETYLQLVPPLSDELQHRARHDGEMVDRFVVNSVRQLDDAPLVQLAELVACLPTPNPLSDKRRIIERLGHTWLRRQQLAAAIGLSAMVLLMLFPPWVARLTRHTRILGSRVATKRLETSSLGHRWIANPGVPRPQVIQRTTNQIHRLEHDQYDGSIDYRQLLLQLIAITAVISTLNALAIRPSTVHGVNSFEPPDYLAIQE